MLLPQALEGVAAVALLYATVRRWFGRPAALLSGLVLALTPVAALMFRFNNPDALLVLLLVAGAYCVTRAVESGQTRWLALAGAALGFAFLTKMIQAFVVLPAFALVYLVAAPVPLRRRLWQLLVGGSRSWSRPAGGSRSSSCGRRRPARTSAARPTTASSSSSSATTASAGSAAAAARRRRRRGVQRRGRHAAAVQRRARRADRLAAAGVGDRTRRRGCASAAAAIRADRSGPREGAAVGRLARRDRRRVQLHERHDPSLLHEHARSWRSPCSRASGRRCCGSSASG